MICSNVHLLSGVDGLLLNFSFPARSKVPLSSLSVVSGLKQKNSCIIAANLIKMMVTRILYLESYLPSSSFNSFSLSVSIVEFTLTSDPGSSLN